MRPDLRPIILLLFLAGCVRTEVTRSAMSSVEGTPYRKILVCSLSDDLTTAATMESFVMDALRKDHVETENCTRFLYPLRDSPADQALSVLQKKGFDGVLVTQREGVATARHPNEALKDQFTTLSEFVAIYTAKRRKQETAGPPAEAGETEEVVLQPYGKERFIYARASLLGIRENQIVWSTGGIVKGGLTTPPTAFMQSFAATTEAELSAANLIPSARW